METETDMMFDVNRAVVLVVDVQGKLAQMMHEKEALFDNLKRLIKGAEVLEVPMICTEQNPDALGPTITEISPLLTGIEKIPKMTFSCSRDERFKQTLESLERTQVLISGIETHICIYQTAVDLLKLGYDVQIAADCVSSRTAVNKAIGIDRSKDAGAVVTSVEMALFEMLGTAEGEKFRQILKIVK